MSLLHNHSNVLCVSAGAGHEVMALSQLGIADVTAVELLDSPQFDGQVLHSRLAQMGSIFQVGFCRKAHVEKDPPKIEPQFADGIECCRSDEDEEEEQEFERKAKVFTSSSSSPPKNTLLLTRCRSAPYMSSSLACRFWGFPTKVEEETEKKNKALRSPRTEKVAAKMRDPHRKVSPFRIKKRELSNKIRKR